MNTPFENVLYIIWMKSRVDVGVIAGKRRINRLLSANDLVLLASIEQGLLHALDLFSAACEHGGGGM